VNAEIAEISCTRSVRNILIPTMRLILGVPPIMSGFSFIGLSALYSLGLYSFYC
jgi:hypothetical protein